jgi:hypothetical protein
MVSFTKLDILDQLDSRADPEHRQFPDLDSGGTYPVGARLSAYRDDNHWAILFETLGYTPPAGAHGGILLRLFGFGNCLTPRITPKEVDYIEVTADGPERPSLEWGGGFYSLSDAAKSLSVQGQLVPVQHDHEVYKKHGIELDDPDRIESHEVLRLLYPHFKELFYAPEETLRGRLEVHVPLVLRLYGWQHPRIMDGERPSQSPSLVAIAEMLEHGRWYDFVDPGVDNVDWRNWPAGGSL